MFDDAKWPKEKLKSASLDAVRMDDEEEEEDDDKDDKGKGESEFLGRSLIKARTILISDPVDHKLTASITAQLLFLDHENAEEPIKIFINSPGGSVFDGYAIYDMIRFVRPRVKIISTGLSASAATVIMLAAEKEDRLAFPNARIMIHQPSIRSYGVAEDVKRTAEQVIKTRRLINELYARETGQPVEKVEEDTDRDYWMSAQEAVDYGLVTRIINTHADLED
jgi:ATP-dependent Clp protease, protease subunit